MARHNLLGKEGENAAAEYLKKIGYEILERNWKSPKAEIDIIATDDMDIVFVEVKTRASNIWGYPEAAVDSLKMKRIIEAANIYIEENDIDRSVRFDVISVIARGDEFDITHFDDAFFACQD